METTTLIFNRISDHNISAAIVQPPKKGLRPQAILPADKFDPLPGQAYNCLVSDAMGTLKHGDIVHNLYFARLVPVAPLKAAAPAPEQKPAGLMALSAIKESLPPGQELVKVTIVRNHNRKSPRPFMFQPEYRDNDPRAEGKNTMTFYAATQPTAWWRENQGRSFWAKIINLRDTARENSRKARIFEAAVEIVEPAKN